MVLQLILNRTKIRALVKDAAAAKAAFGPYIEPVQVSSLKLLVGGKDGVPNLVAQASLAPVHQLGAYNTTLSSRVVDHP